jgi:hypothetical protein
VLVVDVGEEQLSPAPMQATYRTRRVRPDVAPHADLVADPIKWVVTQVTVTD